MVTSCLSVMEVEPDELQHKCAVVSSIFIDEFITNICIINIIVYITFLE